MIRVRETVARRYRAARREILRPLRRGSRTVLWAPQEGLGFGNFMYLWLHAHVRQSQGADYRVLTPSGMGPWLETLPRVRDRLCVDRAAVRPTDRREWAWWSRFGDDFSREQLQAFVRDAVVGSPLVPGPRNEPATLTVNVRRGNYYAEPHFRRTYGFDIRAYLELALPRADEGAERILVVSDGTDWCRQELDDLLRSHAPVVDYIPEDATPQEHFGVVATSQRLVGTNSTFSYWGGYVSNVLYGSESRVVMPWFHARLGADPSAYQLDPAWEVIESLPGGWDE